MKVTHTHTHKSAKEWRVCKRKTEKENGRLTNAHEVKKKFATLWASEPQLVRKIY